MITVQNLKYRLLPFFPLPIKKFSFDIRAPCSFGARTTFCFNRQLDSSEDRAALQQRAITIKLSNMILIFISRSQELQMLFHVPVTISLLGRCLYGSNQILVLVLVQNSVQFVFVCKKHRKNCECCPGHYLSTSVYQCLLVSSSVY